MQKQDKNNIIKLTSSKIKQDELVRISGKLIGSIIRDSIGIRNELDNVTSSSFLIALNDKLINTKINVLRDRMDAYLKILQNIKLTFVTIPLSARFVLEIKECCNEINDFLKDVLEKKNSMQSYFVDTDGNLISTIYEKPNK
jgi:hypothetical protein